jgi:uncharacterized FAD-dependent dehydrogenase
VYTACHQKTSLPHLHQTAHWIRCSAEEILYLSKPHIGTFKLVSMVEKMRQTIESLGGEIRFEQRVDELLIENQRVQGVVLANGQRIGSQHIVCAIGHIQKL